MTSLLLQQRTDGVALLRLDVPGDAVNTLRATFADELERMLALLEREPIVKAVVIASGKPDSFIAGADLAQLRAFERAEHARDSSRAGQRALELVADFRVPIVAAIHGACLGGGLELALACAARVASTDEKTKLGLPEVQLGVLPGLGGTQRLPRLIGLRNALDLLLTGKQIDAQRALRLGLIDELVPHAILLEVAARVALARAAKPPERVALLRRLFDKAELSELALAENPLGRKVVFDQARRKLLEKTRGNYPAAERILDVVRLGLAKGLPAGLEAEARAFGELLLSDEARALLHVFSASNELKKDRAEGADGAEARAVHRIAVLGAGSMGAGIAYVSAAHAKIDVRLKDLDDAALGKGLKYTRAILDQRVQSQQLTATERDLLMARVTATTDYGGLDAVDLVIEAVFEDLELKRRVLSEIEAHAGKHRIFASNTTSITIAEIARGARRPEQVIGMHYSSPVEKMPLLEVIVTEATARWVTATCMELGKRQGKTVIVVRDGAGFYSSRILAPYLSEAAYLLAEGVPIERIDGALVKWGFPVGPMTLLDEIGIDVSAKVGDILHAAFGERMTPVAGVQRLLTDQRLGKKNQRGFYVYGTKKSDEKEVDRRIYALLSIEPKSVLSEHEIAQRCALQMINEAAHCFGEGVLRAARDGDVGAIFGFGFPPFRGGPFHYIDSVGARDVVLRLEAYQSALGVRFTPAPILLEMAQSGGTFYGASAVAPGQHRASFVMPGSE